MTRKRNKNWYKNTDLWKGAMKLKQIEITSSYTKPIQDDNSSNNLKTDNNSNDHDSDELSV